MWLGPDGGFKQDFSLIVKTFDLFRDVITLVTIGIFLFQFSRGHQIYCLSQVSHIRR